MKKAIILGMFLAAFISCKNKEEKQETTETVKAETLAPMSDSIMESSVIYEANIRDYSSEGTFNAFTKDIPQLKSLGVKILWVMPIYPISMTKRKATQDKSIEDIKDPQERKKYLGSYYAISDYSAVNTDYGTMEDFQNLVKTAHDNGMYVILDWVANHTGWDHKWIKEHPEYYEKNDKGEISDPINPDTGKTWGWTDVAGLDYNNKELRKAMEGEMEYWVKNADIDGFRCDVASNVPTDFWEDAVTKIKEIKPVFMLAEAEKPELMHKAFDMSYAWEAHHIMNDIAQGKKTVKAWDDYMIKKDTVFEKDDILMYFTSNHDENSWSGTEYERLGDAVETFAALTYMTPGMPLIYNGQEYDFNRRLKFFEKDEITRQKGKMFPVYEKLGALKNGDEALNGGKEAASYTRIKTSDDTQVLAFEREKGRKKVWYIANLSKNSVTFTLSLSGTYTNYMTGEKIFFSDGQKVQAKPWQYWILTE